MTLVIELVLLALLLVANGSPVVLRMLLGERWGRPLDGDRRAADGRPLFGPSKTLAGLTVSLAATTLCALVVGPSVWIGLLIGTCAMLGDLLSSFVKRRLGLASGYMALGLDQIPESLLPLLACKPLLELSWGQVVVLTLGFLLSDLLISQLMYRIGLGKHPH
jgi:predicted CDP-diglyceride synthetase/phosphatidate cytidylyltransferase